LYDWILNELGVHHPQQIEFARLNLSFTVLSKRKLLELVEQKYVDGWDDPRMPTISGLRKRGYTPKSIRSFCQKIGVTKFNSAIDMVVLENSIREELNKSANRVMAVLEPLRVVITNYPEGKEEEFDAVNNPEDPGMGKRKVKFSREIYIERDDFREDPPKKFFRLAPGKEVRLRYSYFIKCEKVIKDNSGGIIEIHCTYDPATGGVNPPDGRKVKGTIHWVSASNSCKAEARLYDHLFMKKDPEKCDEAGGETYLSNLNPNSSRIMSSCFVESGLRNAAIGERFQFERLGYFCLESKSDGKKLIFNRIVSLRDSWNKIDNIRNK
jgi:glutaminyl-tRNA synthetase